MNNATPVSRGTIFYRIAVIGLLLAAVAFPYEARENADKDHALATSVPSPA